MKIDLFKGATTNATQPTVDVSSKNTSAWCNRVYQATVLGTGAQTATVTFFGSNDGTNFSATAFGTITLSGNPGATDNFVSAAPYPFIQCVTASVTGTGATVNASVVL